MSRKYFERIKKGHLRFPGKSLTELGGHREKVKAVLKRFYYCFIRSFFTRKKFGLAGWQETSLELKLEFVSPLVENIDEWEKENLKSDMDMIRLIDDFIINEGPPLSYILNMESQDEQWGVEREETKQSSSFPYGYVTLWRMDGIRYDDKIINRREIYIG